MIDIKSTSTDQRSAELSNFYPHIFLFEEMVCVTMEGFLQSLKFKHRQTQHDVCMMYGDQAKKFVKQRDQNAIWQKDQIVWWKGKAYPRRSEEFSELITRAYDALSNKSTFRKALLATGSHELCHTIGEKNPRKTILTEREFCGQLTRLRAKLLQEGKTARYSLLATV